MNFQTADLHDEHEELVSVCLPLFQSFGLKTKFYGEIVTIKCHEDNTLVGKTLRNENGKGKVLVVDGGGSLRCALVGDQIASAAIKNEWEGIVIYGCIRDSVDINKMEVGIKAINTNPTRSVKRNAGVMNEILSFGGINFKPGSYLYSDEDGLLVSDQALL